MASTDKSSLMLKQMSYLCPGLHGPESRQRVERRTFGDFLENGSTPKRDQRLLIPLFQRRYCWDSKRVSGWIADAVNGKRDHLGIHNSGNIVTVEDKNESAFLLIVDGQQRITTESLLIAAIRDEALKIAKSVELVKRLEKLLYVDQDAFEKFKASDKVFNEGEDCAFSRLLPSYNDRRPYFHCITVGYSKAEDDFESKSLQWKAKMYFDAQVKKMLEKFDTDDEKLGHLEELANLTLLKMGLTFVLIENEVNLTQVFLWLQEKSLFGEAAMLYNPSPGVDFTCADLVRNLVLASVADRSIREQELFHETQWLKPVERHFRDPEKLSGVIAEFVAASGFKAETRTERHVSELETTADGFRAKYGRAASSSQTDHLMTYARFYSLYEERLRASAMLPPKPKKRFQTKNVNEKKEEIDIDNEAISQVSKQLLKDLTDFINEKQS